MEELEMLAMSHVVNKMLKTGARGLKTRLDVLITFFSSGGI